LSRRTVSKGVCPLAMGLEDNQGTSEEKCLSQPLVPTVGDTGTPHPPFLKGGWGLSPTGRRATVVVMIDTLDKHHPGIRRRIASILAMVQGEAGRDDAPAPVVTQADGEGGNKAAENREATLASRVSASELRIALRQALVGYSAEARSAFLDGVALALELGPNQIIAALEGRPPQVALETPLGDLIEQAETALPPRAPKQARALPDHPLVDPDRQWREQHRVMRAVMSDGWVSKDGPDLLRMHDAAKLLDLHVAGVEWIILTHPDPATRAYAWRQAEAAEAVRRGDKDADRRAIPFGRLLGIQPPAPTSAARKLDRKVRDDLLRKARAAVPAWRDLPPRQAAPLMIQSFTRYHAGAWQADQKRETAPAVEPAATWWRISHLGLKVQIPGPEHLSNILEL
jgi:hypothetical protein